MIVCRFGHDRARLVCRRPLLLLLLSLLLVVLNAPLPAEASSLFDSGNLILINPLQSSSIFLAIILSSVGLEVFVESLDHVRHRYLRVTLGLLQQEITVLGLVEVMSLSISYGVNLDRDVQQRIDATALVVVYIALCYGLINAALAVVLHHRAKYWMRFEWGRLNADAQHSSLERDFKVARRWFMELLQQQLAARNQIITNVPPVIFSVFLGHVEKQYLRNLFKVTFLSWGGLVVAILLSLLRYSVVDEGAFAAEIHSFILLIGYGSTFLFYAITALINRRLRMGLAAALQNQVDEAAQKAAQTDASVGGGDPTVSSSRFAESGRNGPTSGSRHSFDAIHCLLFRSFTVTVEIYKALNLTMLWFISMMIVVEGYVAYLAHGWFCILVLVLESLPPVIFFYGRWSTAMHTLIKCIALSKHVDSDTIERLQQGSLALDNSDDEERPLPSAASPGRADGSARRAVNSRPLPMNHLEEMLLGDPRQQPQIDLEEGVDDEPEGHFGTMHDQTAPEAQPAGDPDMVVGVPPRRRREASPWKVRPMEPIFL